MFPTLINPTKYTISNINSRDMFQYKYTILKECLCQTNYKWRNNIYKVAYPASTISIYQLCVENTYVKVKVTLVQALRLCTGRTAHRGSRGIALLFLDHGTRRGWGVSVTHRLLFNPGKDPVPIVQKVRWAQGPVWTGAENLAPTGIRSPKRPAKTYIYIYIYICILKS